MPIPAAPPPIRATQLFVGIVLALGLASPGASSADLIHFTSGRQKEGVILSETDTMVRLQTKNGTIGIPKSTIERIDRATEEENRALRQEWYVAERREEREREQRRAEREAEREAQAVARRGMVEVDGELVTQAEADRRAQQAANQREANRQRVEKYRQAQQQLPEEERDASLLVFQEIRLDRRETGTVVSAALLNVSQRTYSNIMVDVALVEAPRTEQERTITRQVVIVPTLDAENLHRVNAAFDLVVDPERTVEPRVRITSSAPPL